MKSLVYLLAPFLLAQQMPTKDAFTHEVSRAKGDLNKDGLADLVVVTQDTLADKAPYRLQVFFTQPDKSRKLVVSTTQAIEPQYPNGRVHHFYGNGFGQVSIHSGVLWIECGLIRGHFEHKFRYQKGNFELIGYTYVNSDGLGFMSTVDFNLSTGNRIEQKINYTNDEVVENTKEKVVIKPLPKLQDFKPGENENY